MRKPQRPRPLPIVEEARKCKVCADHLPLGPKPLLEASSSTRILIIGQAPGRAAHESGIPWNDRSGERLRTWLGVSMEQFYDSTLIGLMPMGFCFPGTGKSGDMSPRPECAPLWHDPILSCLSKLELTITVGQYAFDRYLAAEFASLTDAVRGFDALLPARLALPHPSPRNNIWLRKNPWFETDVLPRVQCRVQELIGKPG